MNDFKDFGIRNDILDALLKLGFNSPTGVQKKVIPLILNDEDIIVKSQTGSGKTAAFGIPICEKINIEEKEPQALIITPTRELCIQIKKDISNIGRLKRIRCSSVFGKQPFSIQKRELEQRVHVVSATPGRLLDHIKRGSIVLDKIKYFVIDEADKMLEMGFIDQVEEIISKLPENRVTMLFSATIPEEIKNLCSKYMYNPKTIEITPDNLISPNIEQTWYRVETDEKFDLLEKIIYIKNPDSCIIFCGTKENVDTLYDKMKSMKFSCSKLHGGMLQDERLSVMEKFKHGEFIFLAATDLAARGIDIEDLKLVINYDIPFESENYVHRTGRTGRVGRRGKAITFVSPYEMNYLYAIEDYTGCKIAEAELPSDEEVKKAKDNYIRNRKKIKLKEDKSENLNDDIVKIHIHAGRKKKIRPGDIVGAICSISGVSSDDIGIIDIQDNFTYVEILNGKGKLVINELQHTSIKGKIIKAEKAYK